MDPEWYYGVFYVPRYIHSQCKPESRSSKMIPNFQPHNLWAAIFGYVCGVAEVAKDKNILQNSMMYRQRPQMGYRHVHW